MPCPFSRIEIKMSTTEEITLSKRIIQHLLEKIQFYKRQATICQHICFFYIVFLYFCYLYYFSNIFAMVMADDVENIKNIPNYIGIKLVDLKQSTTGCVC